MPNPICDCYIYNVTITQHDLMLASGNTNYDNNIITLYDLQTCSGGNCGIIYEAPGTYQVCVPSLNPNLGFFHIYQNNQTYTLPLTSSIVNTFVCCNVTPTPTPTPTKTPLPPVTASFIDCCTGQFFILNSIPLNVVPSYGATYYIQAAGYSGCATCVRDTQEVITTYQYISLTPQSDCEKCNFVNPCPSPTPTKTPTKTPTPTRTPTNTPTKSVTPTNTPTNTPTRTPGILPSSTPTPTNTKTPTPTTYNCLIVNSNCGSVPSAVGTTINGKPSYNFSFPSIPNELYRIQWDITNNRWNVVFLNTGQITTYLVNPANLPVGTTSQWISLIKGTCVTSDFNFYTSLGNCPAPSSTPTNTPTNTPTKTSTPTSTQTKTPTPTVTPTITPTNTTTPTQTPTNTITPSVTRTPLNSGCSINVVYKFANPGNNYITFIECCGQVKGPYGPYGTDTYNLGYEFCIKTGSFSASTPLETLIYSASCSPVCPSQTPTKTQTPTPTATPTVTPTASSNSITNPCVQCNLGFDVYQQNAIGQLVVGNLTGSCGTITDYVINWYGTQQNAFDPNNPSQNLLFTSGKGSSFAPYQFSHPMTGTQSPPMQPGYYFPVISKVKINGLIYSLTGGTGTIPTNLNCLYPTVVVSAYTCSYTNITYPSDYNVNIQYITDGLYTTIPQSLSTVLQIPQNVKYLAYEFYGYDIPDILDIKFSGANYNIPYNVECISVGDLNSQWDFNKTTIPKKVSGIFRKVICLTGFTRTQNDYLLISVIPNQQSTATSWRLQWKCLENFIDEECILNFKNTPNQILGSSIVGVTGACNFFGVQYNQSGCSYNNFSSSYLRKYMISEDGAGLIGPGNSTIVSQYPNGIFGQTICATTGLGTSLEKVCSYHQAQGRVITTTLGRVNGIQTLQLTFSNLQDFQEYYDSYMSVLQYSGTPYDSTNINYYRCYYLQICTANGDTLCSDVVGQQLKLKIHPSTQVTTGQTLTSYSMNITLPTISRDINFPSCQSGCVGQLDWIVNEINSCSSTTFSYTSNVGARYERPFFSTQYIYYTTTGGNSLFKTSFLNVVTYSYRTFVYTGTGDYTTYTFIPQLSANTSWYYQFEGSNFNNLKTTLYTNAYIFRPEVTDLRNFTISGYTISNFTLGSLVKVYEYSGGTVVYSNPNFII